MRRLLLQKHLLGSILARSVLGLAISTAALSLEDKGQSVELFQLLALQAVLSVLISGAGFVRGHIAGSSGIIASVIVAYAINGSFFGVLAAILFHRFLPSSYISQLSSSTWHIDLAIVGSVAAALTPLIQGVLVGQGRPKAAYLPATCASFLFSILISVPFRHSQDKLVLLWCASQIVTFLVTLALVKVEPAGSLNPSSLMRTLPELARNAALVGWVNFLNMGVVFGVREHWSGFVPSEIAAVVFFALRVSDVGMQVVFNLLASGKVPQGAVMQDPRLRVYLRAIIIPVSILCLFGVFLLSRFSEVLSMGLLGLCLALGYQSMIDVIRAGSSYFTILLLRLDHVKSYGLIAIMPTIFGAGVLWISATYLHASAFYLFQIAAALLQILLGYLFFARSASTSIRV